MLSKNLKFMDRNDLNFSDLFPKQNFSLPTGGMREFWTLYSPSGRKLPLNSIGDDDGKKSRPLHPPHFGTGFLEDNSRSNHFLDDLSTFVKMKVKVFRVFQTIF